ALRDDHALPAGARAVEPRRAAGPQRRDRLSERLNRYLARSGVASRRAADALIASGSVLVNGRRPPPEGMLIEPDRDRVTMRGETVTPPLRPSYLALNKPEGYVTTASDPGRRPTVLELVPGNARVFPVGRLD